MMAPDGAQPGNGSDDLFADLTAPQALAVRTTEGPVLVLAAAGSGKTRVITRRIAYLIRSGVPAWSILALTFTNKAAGEMRERIAHLMGGEDGPARGLTVTTFHSLCARLLRRYAQLGEAGTLKPDYTIYDSADQNALIKKAIGALNLSTSNWPPSAVLAAISNAKNELLDATAFAARAHDFSSRTVAQIYGAYEKALRAANAVDFDDLLVLTAKMLRANDRVRAELNQRYQYLLIDEYQDTNRAQFVLSSLLAAPAPGAQGPNVCVVGDPDQAIYGWRGADISNILDFEDQYPGAKVIALGENFRSIAPILAAADTLIQHNKVRKHKPLFTSKTTGKSDKIELILCRDERHEAELVTDWLRSLHEGRPGTPATSGKPVAPVAWRDMAVFYRNNALSRVMEDALRQAGIPYIIARGTAFYQREEIKTALAYLRVVANQADGVSLLRIVNTPARGLGDAALTRIEDIAAASGISVFDALSACARGEAATDISSRAKNAAKKFVELVDGWTGSGTFLGASMSGSLSELVERVIRESGVEAMYKNQAATSGNEADAARLDNLAELVSSARQFELEYDPATDPAGDGAAASTPPLLAMLRGYLESVALVADADAIDPAQGAITLMTLHAAKGLEFGAVAMIGLEEGILPSMRSIESDAALEEERRLCFVGITRAMRLLIMTASKYRTLRGLSDRTVPSRFLAELPREHILVSDQSDPGLGLGGGWESQDADIEPRVHPAPTAARSFGFSVGSLVRHPLFGLGEVLTMHGGPNARATIKFKEVGEKTLVLEYARLQPVRP